MLKWPFLIRRGLRKGEPRKVAQSWVCSSYISGSVSPSDLSLQVLSEGTGLLTILPSESPTRLGSWLSPGKDVKPVNY